MFSSSGKETKRFLGKEVWEKTVFIKREPINDSKRAYIMPE